MIDMNKILLISNMKNNFKNSNTNIFLKLFLILFLIFTFFYSFYNNTKAASVNPSKLGVSANNTVYDIITDGDQAYLTGKFTKIGPSIGSLALFDLTSFTLTRPDKVNGSVNVIISDGSDG
jgi:hypothetical protein